MKKREDMEREGEREERGVRGERERLRRENTEREGGRRERERERT